MADSVDGDHLGSTTTSFSQLLFSDEDIAHHNSHFFSSSSFKSPKMLCFGDYYNFHPNKEKDVDNNITDVNSATATPQKSGVTCSDSSSASSATATATATATAIICAVKSNKNASTIISKSNRKRSGSEEDPIPKIASSSRSQRICKKSKMENPISTAHPKARKEKLGERVTALQQLVSPFGKTDTSSVLHEAMGYIKFLQDQIQVLCSPYLQEGEEHGKGKGTAARKDLRSRGLCLVPVESTVHVASSNGADYW